MARNKGIIAIISVLIVGFFYWYYFIHTLRLTEITGKPNNAVAGFFVNLIDFDTGLTRYDIHNLSSKSEYWQRRIREVMTIQNPEIRNIENQKLLVEMMEDPSVKKIAQKFMILGTDVVLSILQVATK